MKKIIAILSVLALSVSGLQAQSLSDIFGKLKGNSSASTAVGGILDAVLNTVAGSTLNVNLAGNTYTYKGSAVAFTSSEAGKLGNLASTAVNSQVEAKVDEVLAKMGIASGAMTFAFATDGTFTCNVKNIPLSGTFTQEGNTVHLAFGKTLKSMKMDGAVVATTDGIQMVFKGDSFLKFAKNVASALSAKSTYASTINTLLKSYDGLNIGFKLKK